MVPAAYGYGLFVLLYGVLFCIALVAHGVWLVRQARVVWRWKQPLAPRLVVIVAAAVTPVVGFYARLVIQRLRQWPARQFSITGWTLVMPAIALSVIAFVAIGEDARYTEATRSWANVIGFLPGILAFYVTVQIVLYMAARVSGLTRHGPLATRVHLVSSAIVLLMMAR
jgi:hypothetical protein